jgi:hypothetical protein
LTRRNTQYLDVSLNPNFSLTRAYAHAAEEEEEEKVVAVEKAVEKADADGETERVKEEEEEEEEQVKMQGRRGRETQREATSTGAAMRREATSTGAGLERQREATSTGAAMRRARETQREIERETGGNRWREKERREKERRVLSGLRTLISGSQGSAQLVAEHVLLSTSLTSLTLHLNRLRPHTLVAQGLIHW